MGLPHLLHCHEQAIDQLGVQRVVVDRDQMAAEFLAQQKLAGRQVVTRLQADQYQSESSFDQVGEWQPWRFNRGPDDLRSGFGSLRFTATKSR